MFLLRAFARRFKSRVRIVEVGPRDGLQNERVALGVDVKAEFIRLLRLAGLRDIEAGSFVSPKWVPQMADTGELIKRLKREESVHYPVLIPNMKGLDILLKENENKAVDDIAVFAAASESFSQKNTNCSIQESLQRLRDVCKHAKLHGLRVRGYVSCIVKCPYEGPIESGAVERVTNELLAMGCYEVSLGDTIGAARVGEIETLLSKLLKYIQPSKLAIHCHDTYGQALANISKALEMGLRTVDASCAGLGGCPYAPGAAGNVATEDVVYMLEGGEYECGVDLNRLMEADAYICTQLGITSRSRTFHALGRTK